MEQKSTAPEQQTALQRLNAFGDRHAKVIILISSVLVIVIVALVARILYDRTLAERASRDMAAAQTVEQLEELKIKYAESPIRAEIIYRLANKYNEQGNLEKAKEAYAEFLADFPNHPLRSPFVDRAHSQVISNLAFLETEKAPLMKVTTLQTHPQLEAKDRIEIKNYLNSLEKKKVSSDKMPTLLVGPEKVYNPLLRLNIKGKGSVVIELFENDTPNSTYHLVKEMEAKSFDGKEISKKGDTLSIGTAANLFLPMEKTDKSADAFSVVLRKAENRDEITAGVFDILLKPNPKLENAIVVGRVKEGQSILSQVTEKDLVEKASVERKRKTPYEPKTIVGTPKEEK